MNAHAKIADTPPALGTVDDFLDACRAQRWFVEEGWVTKQTAVDGLQFLAERAGYESEFGVDQMQLWMSDAFAPMPNLPNDYVSSLVRDWEMDDSRDPLALDGRAASGARRRGEKAGHLCAGRQHHRRIRLCRPARRSRASHRVACFSPSRRSAPPPHLRSTACWRMIKF
ncbi:hypothetical protein ABIF65_003290 [Bradyrhizobium japonicum]